MTFQSELLNALGEAESTFDIRASVRRCFFFDFDGYPVRLWEGQGVLHAGGYDWLGTIDAEGTNHLSAPAVRDTRDGASPQYSFGIPSLDRDTLTGIKADKALAEGRDLTCYHAIIKDKEGLRPLTALRFAYRLTMQVVNISENPTGTLASPVFNYAARVVCRSGEVGRSRTPQGTYTDTSQRERARLLGETSDSFCAFVAANANRTYTIEGS